MQKRLQFGWVKILWLGFLLASFASQAQTTYSFEYLVGKTSASNSYFPDLNANQTVSFSLGKKFSEP